MDHTLMTDFALQKQEILYQLEEPMALLATRCARVWHDKAALDRVLAEQLYTIFHCRLIYAIDTDGRQVSANVSPDGSSDRFFAQDHSSRPFMAKLVPSIGFVLSDVYVSKGNQRPTVTALLAVVGDEGMLGFVCADFDLRDLALSVQREVEAPRWLQIKGDPAIRATVFEQQRVRSPMDIHLEDVISIMEELMGERGVFHGKLHFSSSRATMWSLDDPYSYQILMVNEIIDPGTCLTFAKHEYPARAKVGKELIRPVFERFAMLRAIDDTIYLRSGSLNIINGMVGLNFSCDGSHYIPAQNFLDMDNEFWFGA